MSRYNLDPLAQSLANKLKPFPHTKFTTDGRELRMRCPYCGDSIKHSNSTHLYIKIYREDLSDPFPFYCQRCETTGIVNEDFFKRLNIYDADLKIDIMKINSTASKKKRKFKVVERRNLEVPKTYEDNRLNNLKLKYINKRLGLDLSFEDLYKYKICLNLYDLLDYNNITYLNCPLDKGDIYDQYFVGFLSFDNNYFILRNLSKKVMNGIRYNNFNLFANYENSKKFYVIPTNIDVLADEVEIILTEGIFDILGVYHHIYNKNNKNKIFASVNGVGYKQVILQLLKTTSLLNYSLSIYSDNDQKIDLFKKLKQELGELAPKRINVYYNLLSKDYGVTKEEIKTVLRTI